MSSHRNINNIGLFGVLQENNDILLNMAQAVWTPDQWVILIGVHATNTRLTVHIHNKWTELDAFINSLSGYLF